MANEIALVNQLPDEETFMERKRQLERFQQLVREHLQEGVDFGLIEGTDIRMDLKKPGAQKIVKLMGLTATYPRDLMVIEKDWAQGLFSYEVICQIVIPGTEPPVVIAEGVGECNSMESRYRWRQGSRRCPNCNAEAIIKGKAEWGGGWLCWNKRGGCGAKWPDGADVIEKQSVERVLNEDIADQVNTIFKMAKTRALRDAAIEAGRLSDIFTQDIAPDPAADAPQRPQAATEQAPGPTQPPRQPPEPPDPPPGPYPVDAPDPIQRQAEVDEEEKRAWLAGKGRPDFKSKAGLLYYHAKEVLGLSPSAVWDLLGTRALKATDDLNVHWDKLIASRTGKTNDF